MRKWRYGKGKKCKLKKNNTYVDACLFVLSLCLWLDKYSNIKCVDCFVLVVIAVVVVLVFVDFLLLVVV